MIEARFTTAVFQGRRDRFERYIKGRTPKMLRKRRRTVWSARCIIVRLSSFDGELSVFVDCKLGKTLPYIIVQIQLVFNQFFCFYMNSF